MRSDSSEPADPPLLEVEDAAGAERDRRRGVVEVVDRLVEAERGREPPLQDRVLVDVAVGQRLLDHGQAELVELRQVVGVRQGVVAVGVDHERQLREALADGAHPVDVLAALDLHLDPVVAGGDRLVDRGEQRRPAFPAGRC